VTGADGAHSRRVRQINLVAMLASEYLIAALFAWTSVVSVFAGTERVRLPLALRIAPFGLFLCAAVAIGAMRRAAAPANPPIGDTTPDSAWLTGRIYFNRSDPALFVERRMGFGYTLNFGNPVSWLLVVAAAIALSVPLLLVP
jgi:uncharacterized membrane protein